ncbi:heavy metal translocating P-type ATPase [Hyphomicrobium sp.]|uniref:heavy metal translocating P-type ATPase n=1 Tax=Hyphomicrobium sp. TaxID=82 RepID=UPI000FB6916E|nr:heavy metal translocating P-type ATPase [Hyphomicrobium sp.]RUP11246.1 MAG: cadmium-translocating P-type ATPase [Hyphomicrobium sp.]
MTTHEIRYRIDGMDCGACAAKIETAVRRLAEVSEVNVSFPSETMTVRHRGNADLLEAIEKTIRGLGFTLESAPSPKSLDVRMPAAAGSCCAGGRDRGENAREHALHGVAAHGHGHDERVRHGVWWTSTKGRLTIVSGLALATAWAAGKLLPGLEFWFFSAAMLIGLVPIARRAAMAARTGTPFSIEMLMSIAAVGAVIIGASEEAAAVVFLFQIGELLEGVAAGKARASIQSLTKLVPKTALLEENGQTREVQAESLIVGSTILVRPGDRIPADGIVLSGESTIDEAPVTGESVPVRKGAGAAAFAGTINGEAVLRIHVTAAAEDNTIARVVKLVEQAQEAKAPSERFINRFASYYTPSVVIVAALVALVPPLFFDGSLSEWTYKGLAILLIGCPCALVISTPAAIAAALSSGARRGLLIKGGAVLERLRDVTAVALDKTGTLTAGKPRVTDVMAFGRSEAEVLRLAAALERGSSHPLAKAILDRVADQEIEVPPVSNAKALGGKGVSGLVEGVDTFFGSPLAAAATAALTPDQSATVTAFNEEGKTVSILIADGRIVGVLAMRDEPRADALSGLRALTASGIKTVMLTGDNQRTAEAIGRQLGIEVYAELLPEDKQRIVGELREKGFVVAKIGDGINDAPALAAADIGIAMGGGTDVALETADAAILHGRVGDIKEMITLSKNTMANIHQNVAIALGLKAIFLVTTIIGVTGLWPAILADTGATVLVTGNAMRLLRTKPQRAFSGGD